MNDTRSTIATGTTRPMSASQKTTASLNQGMRNAAGTNTSVPDVSATSHALGEAVAPVTSFVAYANARVKNGAATTKTSAATSVERWIASWFETATTSPSGSARRKLAP